MAAVLPFSAPQGGDALGDQIALAIAHRIAVRAPVAGPREVRQRIPRGVLSWAVTASDDKPEYKNREYLYAVSKRLGLRYLIRGRVRGDGPYVVTATLWNAKSKGYVRTSTQELPTLDPVAPEWQAITEELLPELAR